MMPTLKIIKASPFNYLQNSLNYFLNPALSSVNYILPPVLSIKFSSLMKKIGALDLTRMYLTTINNLSPSFLEKNL
jgi:hypothetical protein